MLKINPMAFIENLKYMAVGMLGVFMIIGIIIASIVNIFLKSEALYFTVSVLGVAVFVGLTAWDTYKIRDMYNENDAQNQVTSKAIYGALMLYLDFVNLFLMLLRFFGNRRN